LIDSLSLFYVA